jgi:hypothetical protein
MHAEKNRMLIPTAEPERILVSRAVPDFTGTVEIDIQLLPSAVHEVEFHARIESQGPVGRSEERSTPVITNDRVAAVRHTIAANADKLLLELKVVTIKASFLRGELKSFRLCEVE